MPIVRRIINVRRTSRPSFARMSRSIRPRRSQSFRSSFRAPVRRAGIRRGRSFTRRRRY